VIFFADLLEAEDSIRGEDHALTCERGARVEELSGIIFQQRERKIPRYRVIVEQLAITIFLQCESKMNECISSKGRTAYRKNLFAM
jgi:hypothetical protein